MPRGWAHNIAGWGMEREIGIQDNTITQGNGGRRQKTGKPTFLALVVDHWLEAHRPDPVLMPHEGEFLL